MERENDKNAARIYKQAALRLMSLNVPIQSPQDLIMVCFPSHAHSQYTNTATWSYKLPRLNLGVKQRIIAWLGGDNSTSHDMTPSKPDDEYERSIQSIMQMQSMGYVFGRFEQTVLWLIL
jgi:hypothetical protein